jgi:GDP-4-dehydro-6-deoxy-D-mannose reductase
MTSGVRGRAYNVCTGHAVRIGELLDELLGLSTVKVRVVVDPSLMRPADTPVIVGDPSRIRDEIGWAPRFSLRDTLAATLDWWRKNLD